MRRCKIKQIKETERIFCNKCGKEIPIQDGMQKKDLLSVEKRWGYFSNKDNEVHCFDLCEECYDELTAGFKIPVEIENK